MPTSSGLKSSYSSRLCRPSFFVAPAQLLSYGQAHGRDGYPDARLVPHRSQCASGGVVVLFELLLKAAISLVAGCTSCIASSRSFLVASSALGGLPPPFLGVRGSPREASLV